MVHILLEQGAVEWVRHDDRTVHVADPPGRRPHPSDNFLRAFFKTPLPNSFHEEKQVFGGKAGDVRMNAG
ncbi:MAG: hypothetical protein AB7S92_14500 [Parvibaculaceae bacterium]